MDNSIRVMVELGKKMRVVACAFDWPGWGRSAKSEEDALRVLAAYRPRYAKVAALAGLRLAYARPLVGDGGLGPVHSTEAVVVARAR